GRRVGGPVQGSRSHDETERILAAPVLCHLSERPCRGEAPRRARRGQHHVGLGFPASRRDLAGFAGIHPEGARTPPRGHPQKNRLRQRREIVPVRELKPSPAPRERVPYRVTCAETASQTPSRRAQTSV